MSPARPENRPTNQSPARAVGETLLPLLRRFCVGRYGIAVGGSFVKGVGDAHSDIDLYLFSEGALPARDRTALVTQALGAEAEAGSWGNDDALTQAGTDFWHEGRRVEVWLRNSRDVEATLDQCLRGEIERGHLYWTVMGFFNYVVLNDLHTMEIVEDPHGILGRWQAAVADYPAPLRRAIIDRFMAEAQFWPENFHYRSAIARGDHIYTSGIVQQCLHALIQVLFALNRVYFPGEKKMAEHLAALPRTPLHVAERAAQLLCLPAGASSATREAQRADLATLVHEVAALVAADHPPTGESL